MWVCSKKNVVEGYQICKKQKKKQKKKKNKVKKNWSEHPPCSAASAAVHCPYWEPVMVVSESCRINHMVIRILELFQKPVQPKSKSTPILIAATELIWKISIPDHFDHMELRSLPSAASLPSVLACYLSMCSPWPGDLTTDLPIRTQPSLLPKSQLIIEIAALIRY